MSWGLSQTVYEYLRANVTRDLYEGGVLNLEKLAQKIGIREILIAEFDTDDASGLLKKEGGDWKIYVNNTDSPKRRRFTIAHEIGHYISYVTGGRSKAVMDSNDLEIADFAFARKDGGSGPIEAEANSIAAKMLMPKPGVDELYASGKTVEEMAEYFQVSESAMAVRLNDLGYTPFELYDGTERAPGTASTTTTSAS